MPLGREILDEDKTRNIIFDLGGVIVNIDYDLTIDEFRKLGHGFFEKYFTQQIQNEYFRKFEKGQIDASEIYQIIRNDIGNQHIEKSKIDKAWCAMLLDTPMQRVELLKKLRRNYNLYLLSNTNIIHVRHYLSKFNAETELEFKDLFDKVYFSNEIGMRKPDVEVFQHVINENGLHPEETVFIDDTLMHVESAQKLGINAIHLSKGKSILDIF